LPLLVRLWKEQRTSARQYPLSLDSAFKMMRTRIKRWPNMSLFEYQMMWIAWYKMMRTSWSRGHATYTQKHQIPGKPSKSGLIGLWRKYNLYLGTSTFENGNPHGMNINSRIRSVRMTPRSQLFFDKSFQFFKEPRKEEYLITHTQSCGTRCLLIWKFRSLICLIMALFILTSKLK
jgi:hypothetical protein